jgi:hypothetical protein
LWPITVRRPAISPRPAGCAWSGSNFVRMILPTGGAHHKWVHPIPSRWLEEAGAMLTIFAYRYLQTTDLWVHLGHRDLAVHLGMEIQFYVFLTGPV